MLNIKKYTKIFLLGAALILLLNSCGIYKYSPAKDNPTNANDRVKKNMDEGKGFRLGSLGGKSGGNFQFATSNPMWRAAIDRLSFAPLSNVDYAGGIIVTDWFGDGNTREQLKITTRFLSNEIRSDAIEIIIHEKICNVENICKVTKIENKLNSEIRLAILKKAARIERADQGKKKEKIKPYKLPKNY